MYTSRDNKQTLINLQQFMEKKNGKMPSLNLDLSSISNTKVILNQDLNSIRDRFSQNKTKSHISPQSRGSG